ERLVGLVDKPRQGFLLEARIVELSSTARDELGVQWNVSGRVGVGMDFPSSSAGGSSAALTVATTAAGHAIEARLGALEAQGRVRIVSRPRVMILEGGRARIESVRVLRVRLPDSNSVVTGAVEGQAQANRKAVEEIRVGVSMLVKPRLLGDGRVLLDIEARSSTLGAPQPPDGIPEELSRMLSAEVVVGDGDTAILGGLRREGSSSNGAGLPLLSRVPVLGALFGRREEEKKSEELLILVTPRLLS
ncbi:MAG: type II and III secretion system protein, partial [bacterium]